MDGKSENLRKFGFGVLIVLVASALGFYLSREPWAAFAEERVKERETVDSMREIEKRRADLVRQRAKYSSSSGKEELARSRGFQRLGEEPVEVAP